MIISWPTSCLSLSRRKLAEDDVVVPPCMLLVGQNLPDKLRAWAIGEAKTVLERQNLHDL